MQKAPNADRLVTVDRHQRAREVAILARKMAPDTERLGHLHPKVLADLQEKSLPNLIRDGASIREYMEVCGILAEGCMSTGWCNFVWGAHQHLVSLFPKTIKDGVWADPKTLVSASLGPAGHATKFDASGGTVSGRWRFNSGCDHASWLLLGVAIENSEPYLALVHESEVRIEDTWQVMGLRGTGSKDVVCESLALPRARLLPFSECIVPYSALLVLVIVGPVIGGAQSAVNEYALQVKEQEALSLLRLSEASAEVDAARAVALAAADVLDQNLAPNEVETFRIFRDTAFAAKLCNQATQRVFEAAGGSALHESRPLQRIFRDVTAGCAHARLRWETNALPYGRYLAQGVTTNVGS